MNQNKLIAGAKAPAFNLKDQNGVSVKLSDSKGKKALVYFYPRASTPGCTVQACSLRDALSDLKKHNVVVFGLSPDLPEKLKKFEQKQNLNFSLLSDPEMKVADSYGVVGEKTMFGKKKIGVIRSAFLIDEKGEILNAWYKISPKDTVPEVLEFLSGLK